MKLSALLAPLLDAKADHETIRKVLLAFEAQQTDELAEAQATIEAARAKGRARFQKWKASHPTNVSKREPALANGSKRPVRVEDKTLTSEIEPQEERKKETREVALSPAFDAFWTLFPNKVGKADAQRKFAIAVRKVEPDVLMAALRRYVAKTDDRPWCNPGTWLHQERWTDAPAPPQARAGPGPRVNPTLAAARNLMDKFDAVTPSEIEGHHPPPRLVAIGGR